MTDILLTTINARYAHAAFGLRYLLANLGELKSRARIVEFGSQQHSLEMLDAILGEAPRIVGIGVYIWNVELATRLVGELKRVRPELIVVLGGPEVSYECEAQLIVQLADYTICGEGDLVFPDLCRRLLLGERPAEKIIHAPVPPLSEVALPYDLYDAEDVAQRVIYVEASRGCPFTCEFCLSALEIPVRQFPLAPFLEAMQSLLDRGVRRFKFVDRTFNLNLRTSQSILEFFLERCFNGLFLHFEMIPDRLPEALRSIIAQFPPGVLQFEVGVQTFNDEVSERISRRQDNARLEENLRFLREETGVHVHADLIVGLPGESLESFAEGFDRLVRLGPQEIQVGMLKRLRGTPIVRHDADWEMVYSPHAPYEILQNRLLDFATMSRLRRFARMWDLIGNSGNFVETRGLIWGDASPFARFSELCEWIQQREGRTHSIALVRLMELVFEYLTLRLRLDRLDAAQAMWRDYRRGGRSDVPHFLREFPLERVSRREALAASLPERQRRHAAEVGARPPS